jgi:hypothetical protein
MNNQQDRQQPGSSEGGDNGGGGDNSNRNMMQFLPSFIRRAMLESLRHAPPGADEATLSIIIVPTMDDSETFHFEMRTFAEEMQPNVNASGDAAPSSAENNSTNAQPAPQPHDELESASVQFMSEGPLGPSADNPEDGYAGRYNFRNRLRRSPAFIRRRTLIDESQISSLLQFFFEIVASQAATQGTSQPPASEEAKGKLPSLRYLSSRQLSKSPACVICMENFDARSSASAESFSSDDTNATTNLPAVLSENDDPEDERILMMPCGHCYHHTCLHTWLKDSNQCPTCRYEIMTDNVEYNDVVKSRMASREEEVQKEMYFMNEIHAKAAQPVAAATVESETLPSLKRKHKNADEESVEVPMTSLRKRQRRRDEEDAPPTTEKRVTRSMTRSYSNNSNS